jgi:hypothetical protein
MHTSRSKIPRKNLIRQRCTEGFNSGFIGLIVGPLQEDVLELHKTFYFLL